METCQDNKERGISEIKKFLNKQVSEYRPGVC